MSVINELLNSKSTDLSHNKVTVLDIDEIIPNPLNKAPMINISDLADIIKEHGLQTPLEVYKQENHKYIIINGERRYRALKNNHVDQVPVIIIPKPSTVLEERMLILDANVQRDESKEYKRQRAKEYEELYYALKEEKKISTGTLKIDWIGMHMNVSGRQIQRYLADGEKKNEQRRVSNNPIYIDLENHIQNRLSTKVKINLHSIQINFNDVEDLNRILELLALEDIVNE